MDCNNERLSKKYIFDTEFENLYYFVEKCSLYFVLFNVINKKFIVPEKTKQDKKAPYFMNLVMITGAWTFILSATLDLLLHTQASFRRMCRDTTADDTIDQETQKF